MVVISATFFAEGLVVSEIADKTEIVTRAV
jgi:hypothetical protein